MDRLGEIDRAIRRTRRYWYDDGLTEVAVGCILLLIAALFYVEAVAPAGPLMAGLSSLGLPVIVIGGSLVARRLVALAKERLTYPRTGYVSYPRRPGARSKKATALVAAATAASVAVLVVSLPASRVWLPAVQGLLAGAFTFYLGHELRLARFYALAAVSVLLGAVAAASGLGDLLGSAAYFTGLGLAFVVSGGLALSAYLRATCPPSRGAPGDGR